MSYQTGHVENQIRHILLNLLNGTSSESEIKRWKLVEMNRHKTENAVLLMDTEMCFSFKLF